MTDKIEDAVQKQLDGNLDFQTAKYEIYCIIASLATKGKSIIMISSEMSELIGMSDRIMVMCEGRVTGFVDSRSTNQEEIMTLATQYM
jgi:methyl-galactoside transport system ATP-binding protein